MCTRTSIASNIPNKAVSKYGGGFEVISRQIPRGFHTDSFHPSLLVDTPDSLTGSIPDDDDAGRGNLLRKDGWPRQ